MLHIFVNMENDKSATHLRVQKNGVEGWLHQTTWDRIGGHDNKEGWVLVPSEPAEVLAIREKKAQSAPVQFNQEEKAAVVSEPFNPEGIVKELKKKKKAK